MRGPRALLALPLLLPLLACDGETPRAEPAPRRAGNAYNVLLITIDTLRADHLGLHGYSRDTSPHIDAFGRSAAVFDQAFTFWPKTRGSFVMMLTGRHPSRNGYSKQHPQLLGFNPTLASVLQEAGYRTEAVVDNPNVAARLGYDRGFERYRETWEEEALETETERTRAISEDGIRFLEEAGDRPFLLWLHYVNPHTPYTPPPPFDTRFLDAAAGEGEPLPIVSGLHGGIPKQWAVAGQDRLGYYVAQYDGEIAAVDEEVGRVLEALDRSGARERTVVVLTSDHGESLGEHDYFFDHGEDLFDPCLRVPLLIRVPGAPQGVRSDALASTLDIVPTVLDALKVSYPPELAGTSLLPVVEGRGQSERDQLYAGNDRNLRGILERDLKLVATPKERGRELELYDRGQDPAELRDLAEDAGSRQDLRRLGRRLEAFLGARDEEWSATRALIRPPRPTAMTREECEKLKALGYIGADVECPP